MKALIIFLTLALFLSPAMADEDINSLLVSDYGTYSSTDVPPKECVDIHNVISAMESLLHRAEPGEAGFTLAVCNTCECWYDAWSSEHYECLAQKARENENYFKDTHELIEKLKKLGCAE